MEKSKSEYTGFGFFGMSAVLSGLSLYLMLFHEFLISAPEFIGLIILGVVPILLWPVWKKTAKKYKWNPFLLLKTYSVTSASCVFLASSLRLGISTETLGLIIYVFMIFNILEAVVFEFLLRKRDGLSKLNAIAGLFILISTPLWFGAYFVYGVETPEIMYSSTGLWILGYTVWNLSFVYNLDKGRVFGLHAAVLSAPFILFLVYGEDIWFQARFLTLALYLTTYNTFYGYFYKNMSTRKYYSNRIKNTLPFVSFLIASSCLLNFLL